VAFRSFSTVFVVGSSDSLTLWNWRLHTPSNQPVGPEPIITA
jgi:hypothetical protein